MDIKEIREMLDDMRTKAYSPYYNFTLGAVLITKTGKIYTGCNIENVTPGPSICAERVAFAKAISEGEKKFEVIYIEGGPKNEESIHITPCGVCRQFMAEFCDDDFKIINIYGKRLNKKEYTLGNLLPESFEK
jgi:cytidine deaminase